MNAITQAHPRLGKLILALSDEPQSTKAWATGAAGERAVGASLDKIASETVVVLHDRRIPGSRSNIDHVVVAPPGVFVIDAKKYAGVVQRKDVGGFFRTDNRLFVGSRDCSKLVSAMTRQVQVVREALPDIKDVPVNPVLCFVDADWALFARPFAIGDVEVTWPRALIKSIQRKGSLSVESILLIARTLSARLPASR